MANYYSFFTSHSGVNYGEIAGWLKIKEMEQQNQQQNYFINGDSLPPLIQQTYYPFPTDTDALKELIDDVCYSKAYSFSCELGGLPYYNYDNVKEKYSETLAFEEKTNFYENKLKEVKDLLKEYYNYDKSSIKESSNFYEKKASEKLVRRAEEIAKILNIKLDEEQEEEQEDKK